MQYWHEFLRFEFADELMLIVGALLVFFSVLKIVRSSLKLLFWVLLAGLGAASVSYGMQHSPLDLPPLDQLRISDIRNLAPGLTDDVLTILCQKLQGTGDQ
jgi:hypothetical protein